MENHYHITPVGFIKKDNNSFRVELLKEYLPALTCLDEFSHVQLVWWAHLSDGTENRKQLEIGKIFKKGPSKMGVFATRSPERPNPVMISTIRTEEADLENGVIRTPFIDAEDNTPVLDIKPLYPMERVKNCKAPRWSKGWPEWQEEFPGFDWSEVINFQEVS